MIELRPLYAKAALLRPDLEGSAHVGFAIQEAVREVCRRTALARETLSAVTLTAGSDSPTVTLTTGRNLLEVVAVDLRDAVDVTKFTTLESTAYAELEPHRNASSGTPRYWAQKGSQLMVWPKATASSTLKVEVAYVPTAEVDSIDLPEQAVTAIEAKAEAMLAKVPGTHQNLQYSQVREGDYRRSIGHLRSLSTYGTTGDYGMKVRRYPGAP